MKKIVLLLITLVFLYACKREDKNHVVITDFTKVFTDSLVPEKNKTSGYTMYNVWIEGHVNDSIKIGLNPYREDDPNCFYFKGEIKERVYTDYYGSHTTYFYFDPYKATEGKLKIRYELN